jgi:hypothetical protein
VVSGASSLAHCRRLVVVRAGRNSALLAECERSWLGSGGWAVVEDDDFNASSWSEDKSGGVVLGVEDNGRLRCVSGLDRD